MSGSRGGREKEDMSLQRILYDSFLILAFTTGRILLVNEGQLSDAEAQSQTGHGKLRMVRIEGTIFTATKCHHHDVKATTFAPHVCRQNGPTLAYSPVLIAVALPVAPAPPEFGRSPARR